MENLEKYKKIAKQFDKAWKKMSDSEKKEIVRFLVDTLAVSDASFKLFSKKVKESIYDLEQTYDLQNAPEVQSPLKVARLFTKSKFKKEEKNQQKIMKRHDRGLLFKDILSSAEKLDEFEEKLNDLCNKASQYSVWKKENDYDMIPVEVNKVYCSLCMVEDVYDRNIHTFEDQKTKVNELFTEFVKPVLGQEK